MLLTITYTGTNTPEIGYLLFKNPNRPQVVELSYGKAFVFYPEVSDKRTTIALLLDINPVDLARGKVGSGGRMFDAFDYVNDRPYVSSSFMSTAISKAFGTAMTGRGDSRQALADSALQLSASIHMLPCGGNFSMLDRVFEPLGYTVSYKTCQADEAFPSWGESKYADITIEGRVRLRDLLNHIYVLIPVFDRKKHYWIGQDEVDKLFNHSSDWLPSHPEKAYITGRYLNRSKHLANLAIERLSDTEDVPEHDGEEPDNTLSESQGKRLNLNSRRIESVIAALKTLGVKSVIDMGCGEGRLLARLIKERQFERIAGMDISSSVIARAENNLGYDRLSDSALKRVKLFQGSLTYRDARFEGYDAACVVEVIEHIDQDRLRAFERVLFEFAKPGHVVLTTPNAEYNKLYQNLADGNMRHDDHRFEWTREEFHLWAGNIAERYGYTVTFSGIGAFNETDEIDKNLGAPTQMAVFSICG